MLGPARTCLCLAMVLAASAEPQSGHAQDEQTDTVPADTTVANAVVADLSLGVLALGYERTIQPWLSVQLIADYYRPWYVSDHVFGFGGELRRIFFLTDEHGWGFWSLAF